MSGLLATPFFLCLSLFLGAEPKERIWTSADGRTIKATLIREVEGDVSLLRDGKVFTLPLERLSAADQQYVRDISAGKEPAEAPAAVDPDNPFALPEEKKPPRPADPENPFALPEEKAPATPSAEPSGQPAEEKPAAALPLGKAKKAPAQDRGWTDRNGQSITARFVRMNGGNAVLMRGKAVLNVPFYNLSPVDQQYLRDYLDARGLADQIPPQPPDALAGGPQPNFPPQPFPQPPPGFPAFPPPPPVPSAPALPPSPSTTMADMLAKMQADRDRRAEERRQQDEERRAAEEARMAAAKAADEQRALDRETARQNALADQAARQAERLANNPYSPSGSPNAPSFPSIPTPGSPFSNISVTEYRCSNCNQVVPEDDSVSKCPHCGISFQYKEDPNGVKTRLSGGGSITGNKALGKFLVLLALGAVFVIGTPIAFIVFLVKVLSSKPPPPPPGFGQRQYY